MKKKPKFTIIIATWNSEEAIEKTLQSVATQTVNDFEVILIDSASTDRTVDIAKSFNDFKLDIISEPDEGIADAWNKGLAKSTGQWVLFLNAGDLIHPEHLHRAQSVLVGRENEPLIAYCNVQKFNSKNELSATIFGREPTRWSVVLGGIGFGHPGSIASSLTFKLVGNFSNSLKIAVDTDWLLRCFCHGCSFEYFNSFAYMEEGGASDKRFSEAIGEFYACATRLGITKRSEAFLGTKAVPIARIILHMYRKSGRPIARVGKHMLIAILNAFSSLIFLSHLRRLFFKSIGFKMGNNASIGMKFGFYGFGKVIIGDYTVINRSCLFDNRDKIWIGDNVSISRNVTIFTAGHDTQSPFFEMIKKPVNIQDHAVIFSGATIMPGVTIGMGAIVHANSVVTKDVESMSIVGGVPARKMGVRKSNPRYRLSYSYPLAM